MVWGEKARNVASAAKDKNQERRIRAITDSKKGIYALFTAFIGECVKRGGNREKRIFGNIKLSRKSNRPTIWIEFPNSSELEATQEIFEGNDLTCKPQGTRMTVDATPLFNMYRGIEEDDSDE